MENTKSTYWDCFNKSVVDIEVVGVFNPTIKTPHVQYIGAPDISSFKPKTSLFDRTNHKHLIGVWKVKK